MNVPFTYRQKCKLIIYFFAISTSWNIYCQAPATISADMPSISPPSPTVASLMKFEEVPVNNYTGIPDVSIPLYSIESLSKDVPVSISFKYHPSSIAVKEVASYTGLGWNLIAGGTISRTVRGMPDETLNPGGTSQSTNPRAMGIYSSEVVNGNDFYDFLAWQQNPTTGQSEMLQNFKWGAFEKNYYDTEHDLYQYNFMGNIGRFYVLKDGLVLTPVKLDNNNNIKIELDYSYNSTTKAFYINGFSLFDDKGYQYVFEEKEITTEAVDNISTPFKSQLVSLNPDRIFSYTSAYQLTKVIDNNNKLLVEVTYQTATERTRDSNYIFNSLPYPNTNSNIHTWLTSSSGAGLGDAQVYGMLPRRATTTRTRTVSTKKIDELRIINKAKISFVIKQDRADSNMLNHDAPKLISMTVKNWYGEMIKQYSFNYEYASIINYSNFDNNVKRLVLKDVIESNRDNSQNLTYTLHYKNQYISSQGISTDYWGYFRGSGPGRETNESYCTTGVLSQMDLPTGGHIVFDYEPNTYSYIGDQPITDFTQEEYIEEDISPMPIDPVTGIGEQPLVMQPQGPVENSFMLEAAEAPISFTLFNSKNSVTEFLDSAGINGINDGNSSSNIVQLDPAGIYSLRVAFTDSTNITQVKVRRFSHNLITNTIEQLYGGGIRIKKISYFDVTNLENAIPAKEKHFNYNFFDNPNRSSGSLAFPRPVFNYNQSRLVFSPDISPAIPVFPLVYNTTTENNNLLSTRTQGSDVGYKNVTVWETGNGKSEYTYTSPIDYPEENYSVFYPFVPPKNFDFKRGLLINEKNYSQVNSTYKLINETLYDYNDENDFEEITISTGIRGNNAAGCPIAGNYEFYSQLEACIDSNSGCPTGWANPIGYSASSTLNFFHVYESYGWAKLESKTTKEYFYPEGSATANILSSTQTFEYDDDNKKITKQTLTNSRVESAAQTFLETLTTNYTYDDTPSVRNRIGVIKKIETKRNSAKMDTKEILYSNTESLGNTAYLPKTVLIGKGDNTTENRLQFTKYDEYSNPVEAKVEHGVPTMYIWGYHSSLPVAIIENVPSNISQTLIDAVKTASDNYDNSSPSNFAAYEAALLLALDNLRNSLPVTSMCTSYTHRPLTGVSTITDPRGYRTTYYYDSFGRLKQVKDKDGKILSENDYNYKMSTP